MRAFNFQICNFIYGINKTKATKVLRLHSLLHLIKTKKKKKNICQLKRHANLSCYCNKQKAALIENQH